MKEGLALDSFKLFLAGDGLFANCALGRFHRGKLPEPAHFPRDQGRLLEEGHPFDHVAQLADIPGPWVCKESATTVGGEALRRKTVVATDPVEEMLGEHRDIVPALAEWRQPDRDDREPMIEVFTEATLTHCCTEILVTGGDDPHIHPPPPRAAQTAGRPRPHAIFEVSLAGPTQQPHLLPGEHPLFPRPVPCPRP